MVKKKCHQINQKQCRTLYNIKTNHFRQLFNQQKSYDPGSFAADQDMTWQQLTPKQLVSISHPTPDLIRDPGRIQLSVFNQNPQIAMHMTRK